MSTMNHTDPENSKTAFIIKHMKILDIGHKKIISAGKGYNYLNDIQSALSVKQFSKSSYPN